MKEINKLKEMKEEARMKTEEKTIDDKEFLGEE